MRLFATLDCSLFSNYPTDSINFCAPVCKIACACSRHRHCFLERADLQFTCVLIQEKQRHGLLEPSTTRSTNENSFPLHFRLGFIHESQRRNVLSSPTFLHLEMPITKGRHFTFPSPSHYPFISQLQTYEQAYSVVHRFQKCVWNYYVVR